MSNKKLINYNGSENIYITLCKSLNIYKCYISYCYYTTHYICSTFDFKIFKKFYKRITNQKGQLVISIRSDHGTEFENQFFDHFCTKHINFLLLEHHSKIVL